MTHYPSTSDNTTTIGRIRAQYRLRPSQFAEKPRLDGLLRQVAEQALELALARAAVDTREIICIRSIFVPVRLRFSGSDSGLIAQWAVALAERIGKAASASHSDSGLPADAIVRYSSRSSALLAMGISIAQGRFQDIWAWRQVGFWESRTESTSLSSAVSEFSRALMHEADGGLSILVGLARRRSLRPLIIPMEEMWGDAMTAILQAAGVTDSLRKTTEQVGLSATPGVPCLPARFARPIVQRALRESEHSNILLAARGLTLLPEAAFALAIVGTLESSPSVVCASSEEMLTSFQAVHAAAFNGYTPSLPGHRPGTLSLVADTIRPATPEPVKKGEAFTAKDSPPQEHLAEPSIPTVEPEILAGSEPEVTRRAEAITEFGGLLFLLRLLDVLKIPERVLLSEELSTRSFSWFLHRLALELLPLSPDDAAALAFCGLSPDAEPPSLGEAPPTPAEQDFVDSVTQDIHTELAALLPGFDGSPHSRLKFVCRRHARILADPGWIEARFLLQDVSLDIRRAGLDLNPNYVPWLGVVVRFEYE